MEVCGRPADLNGSTVGQEQFNDQPVEEYVKDIMMNVRGCQKLSSELAGWHHYRDYTGVERTMQQVNGLLISLVTGIFKHQDIKLGLSGHKLLDQFDMVREGNDALLERINSDIDEASGLKKNADAELIEPSILKKVEAPSSKYSGRNIVLLASRVVQKPQLFFAEKINNSHKQPFIPLIKEKPNNMKPLSVMLCLDEAGSEYYSHPYEYELQHWTLPQSQQEPVTPVIPKPVDNTPIVLVETEEDLNKVVTELKHCKEFAVDLEHHSFRSYQGLTCLMQISTREMDYIIDPLALRGKLTDLNEVFSDPKIVKVFHGADHDILWLQRDCGIYVVNLFDTHQAARVLEYPHRSLAALLYRFCQIEANKVYQRADWRIRPLPEDFISYARQDTHYLLYIYDLMRNELIQKGNELNNLISAVYNRSTELCMKRYEKPVVGPESHMEIYRHSRKAFNSRQLFALQAIYLWRDRIAREQDESPEYVLPKHMLLQIAEVLPKEMQGILACCNPIPPLVKTELLTIHTLIREAREQPLIDIKPSVFDQQLNRESTDGSNVKIIDKHDLSQCDENPSHLSVLLNPGENLLGDLFSEQKINVSLKKKSTMFGCSKKRLEYRIPGLFEISTQFSSPFERYTHYLEMKPFLEGEKKKGADQDRMKRIMDHFLTLTSNTNSELEDGEITNQGSSVAVDSPPSHLEEQQNHQSLENVLALQKEAQDDVVSVERQITHNAIDSFLESARQNTTGNPSKTDHVSRLLSHFRTLAGGTTDDGVDSSEENVASETKDTPEESTLPAKKGKRKPKEKMVLGDDVKLKKGKSKTTKRQSGEAIADSSTKKPKLEEEAVNSSEPEEGELSGSEAGESDGADESAGFDYNKADYSFFQKAKKKAFYKKPVKEMFKGKKPKRHGEKSNRKSFS